MKVTKSHIQTNGWTITGRPSVGRDRLVDYQPDANNLFDFIPPRRWPSNPPQTSPIDDDVIRRVRVFLYIAVALVGFWFAAICLILRLVF